MKIRKTRITLVCLALMCAATLLTSCQTADHKTADSAILEMSQPTTAPTASLEIEEAIPDDEQYDEPDDSPPVLQTAVICPKCLRTALVTPTPTPTGPPWNPYHPYETYDPYGLYEPYGPYDPDYFYYEAEPVDPDGSVDPVGLYAPVTMVDSDYLYDLHDPYNPYDPYDIYDLYGIDDPDSIEDLSDPYGLEDPCPSCPTCMEYQMEDPCVIPTPTPTPRPFTFEDGENSILLPIDLSSWPEEIMEELSKYYNSQPERPFYGDHFKMDLQKVSIDNEEYFKVIKLSTNILSLLYDYIPIGSEGMRFGGDMDVLRMDGGLGLILLTASFIHDGFLGETGSLPDTMESRIKLSRFFRYYINDELMLAKFEYDSHKNTDYYDFSLDNPYPLDQIETIRVELYDHGSPVE